MILGKVILDEHLASTAAPGGHRGLLRRRAAAGVGRQHRVVVRGPRRARAPLRHGRPAAGAPRRGTGGLLERPRGDDGGAGSEPAGRRAARRPSRSRRRRPPPISRRPSRSRPSPRSRPWSTTCGRARWASWSTSTATRCTTCPGRLQFEAAAANVPLDRRLLAVPHRHARGGRPPVAGADLPRDLGLPPAQAGDAAADRRGAAAHHHARSTTRASPPTCCWRWRRAWAARPPRRSPGPTRWSSSSRRWRCWPRRRSASITTSVPEAFWERWQQFGGWWSTAIPTPVRTTPAAPAPVDVRGALKTEGDPSPAALPPARLPVAAAGRGPRREQAVAAGGVRPHDQRHVGELGRGEPEGGGEAGRGPRRRGQGQFERRLGRGAGLRLPRHRRGHGGHAPRPGTQRLRPLRPGPRRQPGRPAGARARRRLRRTRLRCDAGVAREDRPHGSRCPASRGPTPWGCPPSSEPPGRAVRRPRPRRRRRGGRRRPRLLLRRLQGRDHPAQLLDQPAVLGPVARPLRRERLLVQLLGQGGQRRAVGRQRGARGGGRGGLPRGGRRRACRASSPGWWSASNPGWSSWCCPTPRVRRACRGPRRGSAP